MAGEVAAEISSGNGKIKEHCGVDASPCHDLPNGGSVDCNGVKSEAAENGNGKEDVDRTYVFVNGTDDVAENGDNDDKFVKAALVEENRGELRQNGETEPGGVKVNGCNGHCHLEEVAAVSDEAVLVENWKAMRDENGDRGTERVDLIEEEDSQCESEKLGPVEAVDGVNSAEPESPGVGNSDEKYEEESSFEVVERVPLSTEDLGDAVGAGDSKEPPEDKEELPEQVESSSEIIKEVPEPQAVNDEDTEGVGDCRGPVEDTEEVSEKVECTSEVVEVVESCRDADGLDDTKEASKITEQLPLQVESTSEVVEEVPNCQPVSHVDAGFSYDSKESSEHAVDLPVQVESASDVVEGILESQEVSCGDAEATHDHKELSEDSVENTLELSQQVGENQIPEVIVTDTGVSELPTADNEEQVAEECRSDPIKAEKVEESSQSSRIADIQEIQESAKIQADDTNDDVEHEDSVEVAAESSTADQLRSTKEDHDQIAEPSAFLEPSGIDSATNKSSTYEQSLETRPVSDQVSIDERDSDSVDASGDTKEQDAGLGSSEMLASSADCISVPAESAEETVVALDANDTERSLAVADDISSLDVDDREPAEELVVVSDAKEPVLEVEVGDAEATSSTHEEVESVGARDGSMVADDISVSHCASEPVETKICFGSISHEELSSISSEGRSFEATSAVDTAVRQPSPDMESPENDDNDNSTSQGAEIVDAVPQSGEVSLVEGSVVGDAETRTLAPEGEKRFFNYRVRHPRYDGELTEQINEAQAKVDEKTRARDAIQAEIQKIEATRMDFSVELEAASAEERVARDSLKSKKQEIDAMLFIVNKVKNAAFIDDIDNKIYSMEHRIQHETLPLKEEKQLLREIKQSKQQREQLSSNMGKQEELKEALEQKDQTEERLKVLKKEAELLRGNVLKAEVVTKAVKKKHYDENSKVRELQDQFRAADAVRQEAYEHLKSLRMQLRQENKHFYKYKDDATKSSDLGSKGDRDGLSQFCIKQVEDFMENWNNDVEFRSNYIKWSLRGTLRRLGTKDGRSLGVDEQPPAVPPYSSERVVKEKHAVAFPSLEQANARATSVEAVPSVDNAHAKPVEQKKQNAKAKDPVKPSEAVIAASFVSVREIEVVDVIEEPKRTKEEEEKARREEELRKEEEAVRLREQRRLEEKAKAEAALERKKRNAERAEARAAAKAQKEAEQKEKEREKRLKKKERKKAAGSAPADATTEGERAPSDQTPIETPRETETREKVETATKRPQKPTHFTKQTKVKSAIPPPLRNRGKRKMQTWMWVLLVAAVVIALFLAGNSRQLF